MISYNPMNKNTPLFQNVYALRHTCMADEEAVPQIHDSTTNTT